MLVIVFLFLFSTFFALMMSKIDLRIKKVDNVDIYIKLYRLTFHIAKKERKRTSKAKKRSSRKNPSYLNIISFINKHLKKAEIKIYKIVFPSNEASDSFDLIQSTYKKTAILYALISFVETRSHALCIANDAIIISSSTSQFCFDFSVKTQLFRASLILIDYLKMQRTKKAR